MTQSLRSLLATLVLAAATPLSAQVVGHLPEASPFTDANGRHIVSLYLGYASSVSDPAGVGPKGSALIAAQYDYDFASAFYLTTRMGLAPFAERAVLDPLFSGPQRNAGTRSDPLFILDMGLAASLTGEKAWKGIAPRVFTNVGFITSLDPDYDIGEYRFGPKFNISYGVNVRRVTGRVWEWRAELSRMHYRMNYPASYTADGSTIDESILPGKKQNPWAGQTMLSIGIARLWGR